MSKVLSDLECADIVRDAVYGDTIDCQDAYMHFLEDLGALIANHFGGNFVCAGTPDWPAKDNCDRSFETRYSVHFGWNECVPDDGGVYKKYDTDVSVREWREDADE